jgi:uncharacterized surface protein with fasciclin (FAS1) repeats
MRRSVFAVLSTILAAGVFAAPAMARGGDDGTIVDKVVELSGASGFDTNSGDFDILREAVLATGLDERLSRGQVTVFAPTDQAFLDLTGASTEDEAFAGVAALGLDKVRQILKYHVTEGRKGAKQVVQRKRIQTLLKGEEIRKQRGETVLKDDTGRKIGIVAPNAAKVSNGIIHVIDGVLLPYEL